MNYKIFSAHQKAIIIKQTSRMIWLKTFNLIIIRNIAHKQLKTDYWSMLSSTSFSTDEKTSTFVKFRERVMPSTKMVLYSCHDFVLSVLFKNSFPFFSSQKGLFIQLVIVIHQNAHRDEITQSACYCLQMSLQCKRWRYSIANET